MSNETKIITNSRLKLAMALRHAKQIDVVNATGICRSTMNTYYKGLVVPKSEAAFKIANYLMVSPTWLMGITDDDGPDKSHLSNIDSTSKGIDERDSLINSIVKYLNMLSSSDLKSLKRMIGGLINSTNEHDNF